MILANNLNIKQQHKAADAVSDYSALLAEKDQIIAHKSKVIST